MAMSNKEEANYYGKVNIMSQTSQTPGMMFNKLNLWYGLYKVNCPYIYSACIYTVSLNTKSVYIIKLSIKVILIFRNATWWNMPYGGGLSGIMVYGFNEGMYHVYNKQGTPFGGIMYGLRQDEAYGFPLLPYYREPTLTERGKYISTMPKFNI